MQRKVLQTVVEMPEFIRQTTAITKRQVIDDFINFIAREPLKGDLIQGTGGIRKIRWHTNKHSGKRGGMRILYYYHDQTIPIFLFTAYAKNRRANINAKEKIILKQLINQMVTFYKKGDEL